MNLLTKNDIVNLLIITYMIQDFLITSIENLFITSHILQNYSLYFIHISYINNTAIIYLTKHNIYI
jgi:hypothetical protein